jgi:hypothetical protein
MLQKESHEISFDVINLYAVNLSLDCYFYSIASFLLAPVF